MEKLEAEEQLRLRSGEGMGKREEVWGRRLEEDQKVEAKEKRYWGVEDEGAEV